MKKHSVSHAVKKIKLKNKENMGSIESVPLGIQHKTLCRKPLNLGKPVGGA